MSVLAPSAGPPTVAAAAGEGGPAGRRHRAFATGVFLLASGSFFPLLIGSTSDAEPPGFIRLLWVGVYAVAGLALFDGVLRQRLRVRVPLALVLYVALATVSVTWSVDPSLTLRRAVGLAGTVLVGMYLAQRLRPQDLLDALRRALLVVAAASLLLYASGSPLALDEVHETLRGVQATKNQLGRLMAVGLLAAATTALLDSRRARGATLSALPMVLALALTDSTGGSVVAAAVVLCMLGALLWRNRAGRILLVSAVALALSAVTMVLPRADAETVTGLVGEDATLTGRTEIWALTLDAAAEQPWLGYGYEAFWESSEVASRIQWQIGWSAPSAHNGLLDVLLGLGLLGAGLALVALGSLFVTGLRDALAGFTEGASLRIPLAGLLFVSTMAESGLLQQNILLTVLLVAALCVPRPQTSRGVPTVTPVVTRTALPGAPARR